MGGVSLGNTEESIDGSDEGKELGLDNSSELGPDGIELEKVGELEGTNSTKSVIVTKVIGPSELKNLSQMLCMLSHFFNDSKQYDVIVFTTLPWEKQDQTFLKTVVHPTKLSIVLEGPPLLEQLSALNTTEQDFLLKRCGNATSIQNLTWAHHCHEEGSKVYKLGYGWQAEFRSYHIYTHPALQEYKYMMWLDSDAILSQTLDVDPIEDAIRKQAIVSFAAFPYGRTRNQRLIHKMKIVYNHSICNTFLNKQSGKLNGKGCSGDNINLAQIGGFHHVTDLDVFRKPIHQKFLREFVGDYKFSRKYDDQIAVTLVGLMEQYFAMKRNESKFLIHQRSTNVTLRIAHHCKFDNVDFAPCKAKRVYGKLLKEDNAENRKLKDRCGKYFL
ncbi:hypothetical protein CTEN210_16101 [Chaetoceros tenuissimus]|uniref:Uncharacterized protein n=1 Tax=Chaetoceros tenuissimus TaxID=426638 RepID=A0AAD3DA63_9STRA|nr:hypothetical protein CTEN210_16101 [Chaetoceros tenuissimus]